MGVVVDVNDAGMSLSLPNGLRGSVTRAEASDAFVAAKKKKKTTKMTKMKKKTADSSESESESESESDESDSDDDDEALTNAEPLAALFKVGQILRAVVVRSGKGKSGGKRIDLSTRLSRVCDGVAKDALVDGAAVPACVTGVEAHGFVLNFGIDDAPIGFLPRKSVRAEMASSLARGAILDVVINAGPGGDGGNGEDGGGKEKKRALVTNSRVVQCTADAKRVSSAVTRESDYTSMQSLLPGMLVNARVRAVLSDGISVNFMTYFTATIDAFHLGDGKGTDGKHLNGPTPDVSKTHKVGDRCRARVLFVDADAKRIGLTLRPHLVSPQAVSVQVRSIHWFPYDRVGVVNAVP